MSDRSRVAGVAVVGSSAFVGANMAGSASGVPVHGTEARTVVDKVAAEANKVAAARARGDLKYTAGHVVIADLPLGHIDVSSSSAAAQGDGEGAGAGAGGAAKGKRKLPQKGKGDANARLHALDAALSSLASRLPSGTAVIVATQSERLRFGGGARVRGGAAGGSGGDGRMPAAEADAARAAQYGAAFLHVVPYPGHGPAGK